jgi:Zn-dependent protease
MSLVMSSLGDLTVQTVVLRILAALLIVPVSGFALAFLAGVMGDDGPFHDERVSLSPLEHADIPGALLLVLFGYGWIRPVQVNPRRLSAGRFGLVLMVVLGGVTTLALAVVPRLLRPFLFNLLPDAAAPSFFVFVTVLGQLCCSFTVFNLLPLPMLSGQHLLVAAVPGKRELIAKAQPFAAVLLALVIVTGWAGRLLDPAVAGVGRVLLGP